MLPICFDGGFCPVENCGDEGDIVFGVAFGRWRFGGWRESFQAGWGVSRAHFERKRRLVLVSGRAGSFYRKQSCFLFSKNSPGRHGCSHVGYPSSAQTRTLAKKFNADAHAVAALLELPDGSVLSAWSSHGNAPVKENNGTMFYATASRQSGFLEWSAVKSYPSKGCYNNLFRLENENGRIYNFPRSYGVNPNRYYSDDSANALNCGGRFLYWKVNPANPKKRPATATVRM